VLMGLAPKRGFSFIIDSRDGYYTREVNPARRLYILALMICPDDKAWPLYGQWAWSEEGGDNVEDDSPNCARQGDYHNCGVFI
jgi:hypothetical protein